MAVKKYNTPKSFLDALSHRLRLAARDEGLPAIRFRRSLAFDRLLARIFHTKDTSWLLKGGYAMELRMENARATKDVDLTLFEHNLRVLKEEHQYSAIHKMLTQAALIDLGDYFKFEIGEAKKNLLSPPYGGARYPVTSIIADKPFIKFHVDVAIGDPSIDPPSQLKSKNWLNFAGINCPIFTAVSAEQQFSDKIYTYTTPRKNTPNTRMKDLVDLVMLVQSGKLEIDRVKKALELKFAHYRTHKLPTNLLPPPLVWEEPFAQLAAECKLETNIDKAFALVAEFYAKITHS